MKAFNYLWAVGVGLMTLAGASAQDYLPTIQLGAPADSRTIVCADNASTGLANCGCKVKIGQPVCDTGCREITVAEPCSGSCASPPAWVAPRGAIVTLCAPVPWVPNSNCSMCEAKWSPTAATRIVSSRSPCESCKANASRPARPILDWLARLFQKDRRHQPDSSCGTWSCGNCANAGASMSTSTWVQPAPVAAQPPAAQPPAAQPAPAVVPAIPLPKLPPPMPRAISYSEQTSGISTIPVPAAVAPYSPFAPNR